MHIDEFEDKVARSNNKPNFKLTRVPLLLLHYSVFSLHLPFLIFLSVRKPPPQPPEPHFHCFFFPIHLHHYHITIVFPPPPPFYCFPSSSTTTTTVFFLPHLPISIAFPLFPLLHLHLHHHIPIRISTTTTTFQCVV